MRRVGPRGLHSCVYRADPALDTRLHSLLIGVCFTGILFHAGGDAVPKRDDGVSPKPFGRLSGKD